MQVRQLRRMLIAVAASAAGCVSWSGANLVPGRSTTADVETSMGRPAERIARPGGESVWYYPRGPQGRQTYAVRVGADGVVREVSQVLTIENLAKLQPGHSTPEDVRAILGPPVATSRNPRLEREIWEYYMFEDQRPSIVYVQFDPAKRVREVLRVDDPAFRSLGGQGAGNQ
jgi:outer membrane protein assembly factor BamE (lipoprotein component of BamABCDE complex)